MLRRRFVLGGLGFAIGIALSGGNSGCTVDNPNICYNVDGDAFCERRHPGAEVYCSRCEPGPHIDGCVAELPRQDDCWACGGKKGDSSQCMAGGETVGDGDSDGEGDGDGEGEGDGDGEDESAECSSSSACSPKAPLCEAGICVACDDASLSSCADEYPDSPVCDAASGECVQCTPADTSACPTSAPACEDQICVPCSTHDQCPGSACELELGTCFDSLVLHVDGDADCGTGDGSEATPYCTIEAAVDQIGNGVGVVILHQAAEPYSESITVANDGTTVAFVAAPGEAPVWRNGASASLRADSGGRVFVHEIAFQNSASNAIQVFPGGAAYISASKISRSQQAAISISDGTLFLQNSFVGTSNFNTPALTISAGTFEIEYSTLGAALASVILCPNGGAGSTIRNSIALTYDDAPEIACDDATVEQVFVEADAGEPFTNMSKWFVDFPNGDFSIHPEAPSSFIDPLSTFATWMSGDPRVDIDGDARVNVDGQADYAGADVPR